MAPSGIRKTLFGLLVPLCFILYINKNVEILKQYLPPEIDYDHGIGSHPSHEHQHQHRAGPRLDLTAPQSKLTLVHTDAHFLGGFRNQHMRFVALVNYAVKHNISQILLPSLRWGDAFSHRSILHEKLFDVEFWNKNAPSKGLPRLVRYDLDTLEGGGDKLSVDNPPCWNELTGLYHELDEKLLRDPSTNLRKIDTLSMVGSSSDMFSHCKGSIKGAPKDEANNTKTQKFTHLVPYGGGLRSGNLWQDYNAMQSTRKSLSDVIERGNKTYSIYPEHVAVEKACYELIQPSHALQKAIDIALSASLEEVSHNAATQKSITSKKGRLLALHPRIEHDMITHRCSKFMENNLTKVFDRISTYPPFRDHYHRSSNNTSAPSNYAFDAVFVAVSRNSVETPPKESDSDMLRLIKLENLRSLNYARDHGLFGKGIPIFESGKTTAATVDFPVSSSSLIDSNNHTDVIELVASVINFFTAVKAAEFFVGVRGSSFSTDVFSARYYMYQDEAKDGSSDLHGERNYILGPDGIEELVGPPKPHSCT